MRACDARIEAGDDGKPVIVAGIAARDARSELVNISERNPELRIENEIEAVEARGCNADNYVRLDGGDALHET